MIKNVKMKDLTPELRLAYGRGAISIPAAPNMTVFEAADSAPIENPVEVLREGLKKPIGCRPLSEIAKGKAAKDACIVISDHTRAVPNKLILPAILETLESAGIPASKVNILIGNGTHRATTAAEKEELLGREILAKCPVFDHDARNDTALVRLPDPERDFLVNRRYIEAGLKILTGLIEPHFMAGFSGGRKGVCPALAGMETIKYFHGPALLESPRAKPGNLDGNPVHEFATAFAKAAGVDFIVNVTINKEKKISGVFCGEMEKAFLSGAEHCRRENAVRAERKFKIVVTTNGGYPLDRDFYQAVKGLAAALEIVEDGGTIICAAECVDGLGNEHFRKLLTEMKNPDDFMAMISMPGYFHSDQWEVEELIRVIRIAKVWLVSGMPDSDAEIARVRPIRSVEQGLREALKEYGPDTAVGVIPDGPYTLTQLRNDKTRLPEKK